MNIMRRIFSFSLPLLLLAGFFIFIAGASPAHAAPTPVYDINWPHTSLDGSNFGRELIFQKFVPSASAISGLELYFNSSLATINLCKGELDTNMLLNNHACANGVLVASTTCSTNSSPRWDSGFSNCPFSATYALVPGADYYYEIIGATTKASGIHDYTYPGQTCGVQADGFGPYCFPRNHYNGYMARNNLRTYSLPSSPNPVILVPGIMGSWNISGKWELDPILHTYDNLWQALKNVGYEEGKSLFAFPYQWRLSNGYTAELLKQKVQEVKAITGRDKVDIIAHSMGGLIARSYIQGSDYQNDIDQLIFLATPHRGTTKIYLSWEAGELGDKYSDKLMQRILKVEADFNGYGSLFSYIRNLPMQSVEELLPTYDYLRDKDTMILRTYPNNYPVNNFLELLNNPFELNKLNGVRLVNILADAGATSTIENLRVVNKEFMDGEWLNGYPENYSLPFTDHGLEYGAGDSTVPSKSNKDFAGLENIIISSDHANIVTDAQKRIIKELTGLEPAEEVRLNLFKKFFLVRIFSPADFLITAPDGQRLGKDFLNNTAINEIPGAFYSGFATGPEFAVIPDPKDGDYKVELQGTGQGEYKLSVSLIADDNQVDQEFSGQILTNQQRDFNINYVAASDSPLGDLEPLDTLPPVITINKPAQGEKYLHSDNLLIDYTATDDFSGLATTSLTIDGQIIATTTIDLFDYTLGTHNLTITAIDKAGNQAQEQVNFEIIANIDSTISDIEKIHERGWLADKIYEELLKDAFKLLKIQAKYFAKEQKLNEKLIKKTQDDSKLTEEQKQKLIEKYNKKLAKLKENRTKSMNRSLDAIVKLLNRAKEKNLINQRGYDIIMSDIGYLRENL